MKPLALITGSTGFIGSTTTLRVLEAGYRVRLVIRREQQADKLRRILSQYVDDLDFITVPDLTISGCYDRALRDVEYVLHIASPLPTPGNTDLLTPAVKGTTSMLQSALEVSSIRKVVITSSVLAFVPLNSANDGLEVTENDEVECSFDSSKVPDLDPMAQYHISKLASHKATLEIAEQNHPHFDIVTLHPVYVFGRNILQETADEIGGTPGMLFQSLMSDKPLVGQFRGVHINDVAEAHVRALRDDVKGLNSYLLASESRSWVDVAKFLRERYPAMPFGLKLGDASTEAYRFDASKAGRELGIKFKGMEDQVGDVVDQQVELRKDSVVS